jgi:uncharacterized protein (TIGR02271 family)
LKNEEVIYDADGKSARVVDTRQDEVLAEVPGGRRVWLRRDAIRENRIEGAFEHMRDPDEKVVPVMEEHVRIERAPIESAVVQVRKEIRERQEVIREPVFHEEVEVERVPVNRMAEGPVTSRYEGDTLIVPLVEEVVVVEKRLKITEELHIRKRRTESRSETPVTLRREEVSVDRVTKDSEPRQRGS